MIEFRGWYYGELHLPKGAFIKYVRSEGEVVGLTKAKIPYKNCPFSHMKSEQGGGQHLANVLFECLYSEIIRVLQERTLTFWSLYSANLLDAVRYECYAYK